MSQKTKQIVVTPQASVSPETATEPTALFNAAGAPFSAQDLPIPAVVTATAIGTAAKTTTSPEPKANTIVPIKFTNGNSVLAPTVAFNGGTARAIQLGGSAPAAIEITVAAGGVALFWFDGTVLHQMGVYS